MAAHEIDLGQLALHSELALGLLIPQTIYRVARRRAEWRSGETAFHVSFAESDNEASTQIVKLFWNLDPQAEHSRDRWMLEDLRKLAHTSNSRTITEAAGIGAAYAFVSALLPHDRVSSVVQTGGRGDFYLNGRHSEMIEISGTLEQDVDRRFEEKRAQVLQNTRLVRAFVCVTSFGERIARLERVK